MPVQPGSGEYTKVFIIADFPYTLRTFLLFTAMITVEQKSI